MKVEDPERPAPRLPQETERMVIIASVETGQVGQLLGAVNVSKAIGLDGVSPRLLKYCAKELSGLLSSVFTSCLRECK